MSIGRLLLRTTVGGLFVGHGTQKLFGWFGGGGIDGTTEMFSKIGMYPPRANAIAAGVTEAGCGAALVLGAGTPLASAGLIATMLTAVRTVHWRNGVWSQGGGWEYNAVLIGACAALAETGPGSPSLDGSGDGGPRAGRALLALALGAGGAAGAKAVSDMLAPSADEAVASQEQPVAPAASDDPSAQ